MPRVRRSLVAPNGVSVTLHCYTRCVRGTHLCGYDKQAKKDYSHRRQWLQSRLEFLAAVFAIDILGFAVMGNHFHLICRTRPEIAANWSDREVARRWNLLFPKKSGSQKSSDTVLSAERLIELLGDNVSQQTTRADELRTRFQSISWFMKCLCEDVAKRANKEDGVTGAFWEGRFKSQKLLDEQAILACSVYVDLNPIRAAVAETPEESQYTGIYERVGMESMKKREGRTARNGSRLSTRRQCFLTPVKLPSRLPIGSNGREDRLMISNSKQRASDKGFLSCSLLKYLRLLDWTGRVIRTDKRGTIPKGLTPVLERLDLEAESWFDTIRDFKLQKGWAVGRRNSVEQELLRVGRKWIRGSTAIGTSN